MKAKMNGRQIWMLTAMVLTMMALLTVGSFAVFAEQTPAGVSPEAQDHQILLGEPFKQPDHSEDAQVNTQVATFYVEIPAEFDYDAARYMHASINHERAKKGLAPLRVNREAVEFAMERAVEDQLCYQKHHSPRGYVRVGRDNGFGGENEAFGRSSYGTVESLQKGLINSPGHYGNMTDSDYRAMGAGYVRIGNVGTAIHIFSFDDQSGDDVLPSGKVSTTVPVYFDPSFCDIGMFFTNSAGDILQSLTLKQGDRQTIQLNAYGISNDGYTILSVGYTPVKAAFTSTNPNVVQVDDHGNLTAVSGGTAKIIAQSGTEILIFPVSVTTEQVAYRTHVQDVGWQLYVTDGAMAGTSQRSLRLEAMNINLKNQKYKGDIEYRTHIQNIGWESEWKKNDAMSGTSNRGLRLEAMQVRLTGEMAEHYDVYYRVHAQNVGWLNWAKNGEQAGTAGYGYRLEAMQVVLVEKDGAAPNIAPSAQTNKHFTEKYKDNVKEDSLVVYQTHVQNVGWQNYAVDGGNAGTSGQSLRLEGMKMYLNNPKYKGDIEYRTHIQNIGWENEWKKNNAMSGTSGLGYRLEAMQIRLTGEMAEKYDVYYRVHAENIGWMNWAKNGEQAGTAGYGYRLEAMQVVLVDKGGAAPALAPNPDTDQAFVQKQ